MTAKESKALVAQYAAEIAKKRIANTETELQRAKSTGNEQTLKAIEVARCPANWREVTYDDLANAARKINAERKFENKHIGFVVPACYETANARYAANAELERIAMADEEA